MKIVEKCHDKGYGNPTHIRYEAEPGVAEGKGPAVWKFEKGWHFFLKPFAHDPIIIREFGGGWYLRAPSGNGVGERVAGPFPCRKAAIAAWRLWQL